MSGPSLPELLGQILRPWPYRLLFYGLVIVVLFLLRERAAKDNGAPIGLRRFGVALLSGQFLAVISTVLFVGFNLHWQMHPAPIIVEKWAEEFWHFYVDAFFSEIGLGVAMLWLVQTDVTTWESIGAKRPSLSTPLLLSIIISIGIMLHLLIRPVSTEIWKWCLVALSSKGHGPNDIDSLQWEVWSLRQTANQIGILGPTLIVLWMGVFEPIVEEVFFRGLLFKVFLERTSTWMALIAQALLFAMIHLELVRLLYLFVFGLILGYLVKRTSSLLPAVLLHILVNVFSLIVVVA